MCTKVRQEFHQSAAESAIDNVQRRDGREVDKQERCMAQESVRERNATCILRRIARTHKLYTLEANPSMVAGSPEST